MEGTATQTPEQRIDAQMRSAPPAMPGYNLTTLCGQGTFGEVWAGVQLRSGQKVAVKIFRLRNAAFQAEVERLSLVAEHPNVVKLLDADLTAQPPYFIMNHYPDSLASRAGSEVAQVVNWMGQIGRALRHTHRRGLLHCDLKPSNILLDVENQAQLADFGQSVLREGEGSSLGSLGYMAPEQANPKALPDVRWDVYALGATAYFLLTGEKPRSAGSLESYGSSHQKVVPVRQLNPKVDADLAVLVEACLAWEPEHRPDSMDAVLEDLERRRKRLPLLCRRPWKPAYVAGRFLRRHWLASLFAFSLLAGALVLWQQFQKTRSMLAEQDFRLGWQLFEEGEEGQALLWWAEAVQLAPRVESYRWPLRAYAFPMKMALRYPGRVERVTFSPDGKRLLAGGDDGSARLFAVEDGRLLAEVAAQASKIDPDPLYEGSYHTVDFSPDGQRFVMAGDPPRLWEGGSLKELGARAMQAYFSPDGKTVLLATSNEARLVAGSRTIPLNHDGLIGGALFTPDGRTAVTFGGRYVKFWDAATGKPGPVLKHPQAVFRIRFDREGKRLVSGANDGARVWTSEGKQLLHINTEDPVMAANFSRDGKKLVLGCAFGGTLGVYSASDGRALLPPRRHRWGLVETMFTQDDRQIFSYSYYGTARFWHAESGEPASPSFLNDGPLKSAALRPDGRMLVIGTNDGSIRIFELAGETLLRRELAMPAETGAHEVVYLSPDAAQVANRKGVWSTRDGRRLREKFPEVRRSMGIPFIDVSFSADGRSLALSGAQPRSYQGEIPGPALPEANYFTATLDPSGERIVTLDLDSNIRFWEARTGKQLSSMHQSVLPVKCAFRPDGQQVAIGSVDAVVRIYDGQARLVSSFEQGMFVSALAYSPDGTRLAVGCGDGTVRVWDAKSGKPISQPIRHEAALVSLAFDASGRRLASACLAGQVRVADATSGDLLLPRLHHLGVSAVAFSPEGLLTASGDKLRVWDVTPPEKESPERVKLRAEVVTGMQLDGPLSLPEWEKRKARL